MFLLETVWVKRETNKETSVILEILKYFSINSQLFVLEMQLWQNYSRLSAQTSTVIKTHIYAHLIVIRFPSLIFVCLCIFYVIC